MRSKLNSARVVWAQNVRLTIRRAGRGPCADNLLALLLALTFLLVPTVCAAQGQSLSGILPEIEVRGQGWTQGLNFNELLEFGLAFVEIIAITLLVSFHPSSLAARETKSDYDRPRVFFIYALIGMTVGFLVLHHGYVIGFVIFGMGGLLRFRGDSTSTADTTRLILATLLGLCIGLNLPAIALFATLTGWIGVYIFALHPKLQLEVRFNEKKNIQQSTDSLVAVLQERGFKTLGYSKSKFKPNVEFVLEGQRGDPRAALMREMNEIQAGKLAPVADWHVS